MAAILLAVSATAIVIEGAARLVLHFRNDVGFVPGISRLVQRGLDLDPYEMPSPTGGPHWVLRPDYRAAAADVLRQKQREGRVVGAGVLRNPSPARSPGNGIRINADGFKGPELDRSRRRPRILALGDSTTFGYADIDYPRVIERTLARNGLMAEVINGGVEGYSADNLLYEIERYKRTRPQIVVLYIGWNSLFSRSLLVEADPLALRSLWLLRRVPMLFRDRAEKKAAALRLYRRAIVADGSDPAIGGLPGLEADLIGKVDRIVTEMKSAGARVVLATLPGLFTMQPPGPRALEIGHLPEYTDNAFVLAAITRRYNAALRRLAAVRGLAVIDLAAWSERTFQPREDYFVDSVHLTISGIRLIGEHMAAKLAPLIRQGADR